MVRDTRDDLVDLQKFVREYEIKSHLEDARFEQLLSTLHKRYFALLTIASEIEHQVFVPVSSTRGDDERNQHFTDRLAEFVSDVGSGLFVWLHGAYKPAALVLRSSIENFVKSITCIHTPEVLVTKSVYEVFDFAKAVPFFANSATHAELLGLLIEAYSELNLHAHTATRTQMQMITALGHFPAFDLTMATQYVVLFRRVVDAAVSVICLMFPEFYRSMHFRNTDIVQIAFSGATKRELTGVA